MVRYEIGNLFKWRFQQLGDETQKHMIVSFKHLLDWMGTMPNYKCKVRTMLLLVPVKGNTSAVFRYVDHDNKLVAVKIHEWTTRRRDIQDRQLTKDECSQVANVIDGVVLNDQYPSENDMHNLTCSQTHDKAEARLSQE